MNKTLHADKLSSVNFYVQVPNGVRNLIGLSGLMTDEHGSSYSASATWSPLSTLQ
jgi:hypothetical protein